MGVVLRSVLADFNWTHAKTEAARRKDLETVLNLLSWQLATLLVSMVTLNYGQVICYVVMVTCHIAVPGSV